MSKTVIAPIIAVLALIAQAFGYDVPQETVNEVVLHVSNVALGVVAIVGILKNFKKKEKEEA